MQNGFVQTDDTRAIIPRIQGLADAWAKKDWPIVASRFINIQGSNWERLRDWHDMQSGPATNIVPDLTLQTSYIFKKGTYSAWSDEVSAVCAAHSVQQIVIVGVDTNECVLATAIDIFDAGLTPIVVKDCCASSGGKQSHDMGIALLSALIGPRQIVARQNLLD